VNQILSQDEVDALLRGLDKGEIETEQESLESDLDVQPYDWNTQGKNLKHDMPLLALINDRFAVNLKNSLSASLRRIVEVEAAGLELIKFEEFQRALPIPTSLHLFKMEPLKGTGMLVLETRLVFNLLEAYLGGRKIINKIVSIVLDNMNHAWAEIYPIHTHFIRSETNALAVNVVHATEFLVSAKMELEFNKPIGHIIVCLPYASIQPIREKLSGGFQEEGEDVDKVWVARLKKELSRVPVVITVDLGYTHLPVREFLNMLVARVEGRPKFLGVAGKHHNRKVFKVQKLFSTEAGEGA